MRSDWVAFVAALALLLVMAMDWYSTAQGEEARRVERIEHPSGAVGGEIARRVQGDAKVLANEAEKNAWQAHHVIDRVILAGLLATILLAIIAAYLRAAARRFDPPWSPTGLMATTATFTGLLLGIEVIRLNGDDVGSTIELGAPLGILLLGLIALAGVQALRGEESGRAWREIAKKPRERPPAATPVDGAPNP
jgi:hypothetical protein